MGEWRRRPATRAPKSKFPCADLVLTRGRQYRPQRQGKLRTDTAESQNLSMCRSFKRENRESLTASKEVEATLLRQHSVDRPVNVSDGSTGMHADRKSDGSVVPAKSANKGGSEAPAEWMEERDPAERNTGQADLSRAQNRNYGKSNGMVGMRETILRVGFAFDSRQESYEVVPHVRICAGGRRQRRFLPQ